MRNRLLDYLERSQDSDPGGILNRWVDPVKGWKSQMQVQIALGAFVLLSGLGALFFFLNFRNRRLLEQMKGSLGRQVRQISQCGIVRGSSRIPGVLAMLPERLVYRGVVIGFEGEELLFRISGYSLVPAAQHPDKRVKKFSRMMALEFQGARNLPIFLIPTGDGSAWQVALRDLLN